MLLQGKGTPVRIAFDLSGQETIIVEPLRFSSSGLRINRSGNATVQSIEMIGEEGKMVASIELPTASVIEKIQSFVIYPDGTTWTGRIFDEVESGIELLIWNKNLSDNLNIKTVSSQFVNSDWQKIPTVIAVLSDSLRRACPRIEHTCTGCDKFSKAK